MNRIFFYLLFFLTSCNVIACGGGKLGTNSGSSYVAYSLN